MSIVEGFGGMRVKKDQLHFAPKIPKGWTSYFFKVNFRNHILKVEINHEETHFSLENEGELQIVVDGKVIEVKS
jgi:maltose phosphorylase